MKTSTILLLTYFGLLLAGILALFITSKTLGKNEVERYMMQFNTHYNDMADYSVVVLEKGTKCRLIFADSCNLSWDVPIDTVDKRVPAFVRNDTLYVTYTPTGNTWNYRVMAKFVKSVFVKKGACVRLFNPAQNELSVFVDNGECILDTTHNQPKADRMWKKLHLKVQAKNDSRIEINSWIRELSAQLDSSKLNVNSTTYIQKSTLSIKKNARVTLSTPPTNLSYEKDSISTINLY